MSEQNNCKPEDFANDEAVDTPTQANDLGGQPGEETPSAAAANDSADRPADEGVETADAADCEVNEAGDLEAELDGLVAEEVSSLQAETEQLKTQVAELEDEVARRKADLFNLQQEYSGYVKRSKTEVAAAREVAAGDVVEALLPVLDEIELARKHGDLTQGPFKVIAEKLESILGQKYQLERYGQSGDQFDPNIHEALMATQEAGIEVATVKEIVQPGYRLGEKVVRPARVMVANPA